MQVLLRFSYGKASTWTPLPYVTKPRVPDVGLGLRVDEPIVSTMFETDTSLVDYKLPYYSPINLYIERII